MPPKRHKRKSPSLGKSGGEKEEDALQPKTKLFKPNREDEGEAEEANAVDVQAIKKAIKAKTDWAKKIREHEILARYKSEAAAQGANRKSVAVAFHELLKESVIDDAATKFKLTMPQNDTEWDDDDLRIDWDERSEIDRERGDVCFIDGLIPEALRATLESQLDVIANSSVKDFHPGSDGKVQDLVHPSLFPYIRGLSFDRNPSSSDALKEKEDEEMKDDEEEKDEDDGGEDWDDMVDEEAEKEWKEKLAKIEGLDSIYQWLPAEYRVGEDGEVDIESYINNLDRKVHPELYDTLAKVFRLFLPMFEKVLARPLNNTSLQVITKAANYVLQPGQDHEGSWHVEGMKHENIVASGIYYYSTTANVPKSSLAFRELRDNSMEDRMNTQSLNFNKNVGKVETPMGRSLVFENSLQHKVKDMSNESDTVGTRKILCFFLVNPDNRIKSSADIPEQQWDRVKRETALAMCGVIKKLNLQVPPELLKIILEFAKWGFTMEEALAHRLELMKERKYYVDQNNRIWERNFSFCEH